MLTLSKPLSAGQAQRYHAEEFQNGRDNYYTVGDRIRGTWHGQLAAQWGLQGEVREEHFQRLANGQHPVTGEQLIRHQPARTYPNQRGETVTSMQHRAGWDATFSAPKSVSLTALVGGDARVREAHQASVQVALDELEPYVQARLGGDHPAETTGRWVAALFEHDSARPVDGYAAPQLHTHVVFFNLTETAGGDVRALQPRELYLTQQYATTVYRSELAWRLGALGYEVERGHRNQPEIRGYTHDYLDASSPRRQQIEAHLAEAHRSGSAAAQIAAHQTREPKLNLTHEEMQRRHREMADAFGNQPDHVVLHARQRVHGNEQHPPAIAAHAAVTFAKERNLEREAVVDERSLVRDALRRSMGEVTVRQVKHEFEARVERGEFIEVPHAHAAPGRAFTTREMRALEHDTMERMRRGQHRHEPLVKERTRQEIDRDYQHLSESQCAAVQQIFASRDQMMALEGVAGGGKTTALSAVRDAAEREGYMVEGFAPTSRAARNLGEAGLATSTLQRYLARGESVHEGPKRLYVLDESSLASTKQIHAFVRQLRAEDRVLLVGDVRQHQAVEAGRPYQQLQEAGLDTARLDHIVRQRDPALRAVVTELSRGEVSAAVQNLDRQGRLHEIGDRDERHKTIAREYLQSPENTLVVSPDNQSRVELNQVIHRAMQAARRVEGDEHCARVLTPRQDLTGADRKWAAQYQIGDVIRYSKGSRALRLDAGEYARVERTNHPTNNLVVKRETGGMLTYDPRRLHGVTVYREAERAFSRGDRVQLTAPDQMRKVANRELGTVETIDAARHLSVRLDSGRTVTFTLDRDRHLDYGYAVTSHSSQGLTADRVLVHIDTARAGEALLNRRFAYVAVSRGRFDAQLYVNDKTHLAETLSRDVSHRSAIELTPTAGSGVQLQSTSSHRPAERTQTQLVQGIGR